MVTDAETDDAHEPTEVDKIWGANSELATENRRLRTLLEVSEGACSTAAGLLISQDAEITRLTEALAEMTDDRNEYLNFWRKHRAELEDMAERDSHGVEPEREHATRPRGDGPW